MGLFSKSKPASDDIMSEAKAPSVAQSATLDGAHTPEEKNELDDNNPHKAVEDAEHENHYPTGAKLAAVLMSLALAVFLVSIGKFTPPSWKSL